MRFRSVWLMFLAIAMTECCAFAHDGHGHSPDQGQTLFHYVTEPLHLFEIVAITSAAATIIYLVKQRRLSLRYPWK